MTRVLGLLGIILLLSTPVLARATEGLPPIWRTGLDAGDQPETIAAEACKKVVPNDCVLWQAGRVITLVKAGQMVPKELSTGILLSVRLVTASGSPVGRGLSVQWRPQGLPNLPEPLGRIRTNEKGIVVIGVEADKGTVLWIDDPVYLPMVTLLGPGTQSAELLVISCKERVLLARDAFGRALAGSQVKVIPLKSLSDPVHLAQNIGSLQRTLQGDEVGRISLPKDLGHACACAWAPRCTAVDVPSVDNSRTLVFRPAKSIRVHVMGANSTRPVRAVRYEVTFASERIPWLVFRESGSWPEGVGAIAPGAYQCKLSLKCDGWANLDEVLTEPPPGGRLDLSMQRGATLMGVVQDTAGLPVLQARVDTTQGWGGVSAETDSTGAFELKGVPVPLSATTLYVSAHGFLDKQLQGIRAEEGNALKIVLSRGAAVTGRVVDEETRQPVADAHITFMAKSGSSSQGFTFGVAAGADGSFRATGLDPDTYDVKAWAENRAAKVLIAVITSTETQDLGDIALSGHPVVKGLLLNGEDNPPAPGAKVQLERLINFKEVQTETVARKLEGPASAEGAFEIRGVASGSYRLVASDGESKKVVSPVAVRDDDVDVGKIRLEKACSIRGRVARKDGQSASSWRITLATQAFDFDPPTAFAEDDGTFQFEDLPAGVYRLQAFSPLKLMPEADQRVELAAGQELEVTVPVGGLTVTAFLQIDGRPAGSASVSVSGQSDAIFESGVVSVQSELGRVVLGLPPNSAMGTADGSGQVTLEGVSPGLNQASLRFNEMSFVTPVSIPAEPSSPLTWNFIGIELDGRVLNPDGSPAQSVLVSAGYQGVGSNPGNGVSTDAAGNFRLTGLGEGTIVLGCRSEGGLTATAMVTLNAGQPPPPVILRLKAGP